MSNKKYKVYMYLYFTIQITLINNYPDSIASVEVINR